MKTDPKLKTKIKIEKLKLKIKELEYQVHGFESSYKRLRQWFEARTGYAASYGYPNEDKVEPHLYEYMREMDKLLCQKFGAYKNEAEATIMFMAKIISGM